MKIGKKKNILEKKLTPKKGGVKSKAATPTKMASASKVAASASKTASEAADDRDKVFKSYIYKLMKSHLPEKMMSKDAVELVNNIVLQIYDELARETKIATEKSKQ